MLNRMHGRGYMILASAIAFTLASCSPPEQPAVVRSIDVLAASSMKGSLEEAVAPFEKEHSLMASLSYGGSQELAQSISHGAPCDVFISANKEQMDVASAAGRLAEPPSPFLKNSLAIVFSKKVSNPTLAMLGSKGFKVVLAAETVPAGKYARQMLMKYPLLGPRALANVVSNETNVRLVLTKVELGEADAGIVYKTDALSSNGKVKILNLAKADDVPAQYWIAALKGKNEANAKAMVEFLRSDAAHAVFLKYGFQ